MSNNRFIIILTVLVFVLSGFISWRLLSPDGGDKEISIKKQASILDSAPNKEGVTRKEAKMISSRNAVSITIASDRNRVDYYESTSGVAYEVGLDGSSERALSSSRLPNFLSTIWSPNKKEVISEFAATGNSRFYSYYNYTTKKSSRLAPGIKSVTFSPAGDRIAYFKEETDGLFGLFVSAPDGSTTQRIMTTRITDAEVFWPTKNSISLRSLDEDGRSNLFLVSVDGKMIKILSDKSALKVLWRADGGRALVSYLNDDGIVLSVVDPATSSERNILTGAAANECSWNTSESVVCRIAENSTNPVWGAGLYNVSIRDGSTTPIQGGDRAANEIGEILVDPTSTYVIFTSARDGKIFSIKI